MTGDPKKIRIAIKYCGGCNPDFDRGDAVARMLERLSGTVAVVQLIDDSADMLVAIEGCPTACADLSGYKGDKVVILSSREDVEAFYSDV
ncbi:MAG: hypothetical protein JRI93_06650 [Deltaproteobacteria bacterium]|nr:hypothetical protein [Deltaproteobacteria bacterium]MBW2612908.1 hypothetical protein [Deltaproteobacteria bacterium]MBW2632871.1 hypothetical protein [Deltaproteobacteria bacterium]MBW2677028.1 hypothetical protein [Deltaproteobacteria bacterium]